MMRATPLLLLLAACSAAAPVCRYDVNDARRIKREAPDELVLYFTDQLLCGRFADAHKHGLSAATQARIPYEVFFIAVTHEQQGVKPLELDITRRLLGGLRQEGELWVNPDFGFRHPVRRLQERIGRSTFWSVDFTREELEGFMRAAAEAALAWFRKQRHVADNKLYTYPPDWQYTPLGRP